MNDELVETCLAYLDGDLDEAELKDFAALLTESDEAADQLAELALDEQHYRQVPAEPKDAELPLADALAMPGLDAAFNDGVPTIQYTTSSTAKPQSQYASALTYVVKQTFTPKRIAVLATAAVVLLGVVLAVVLLKGPDETDTIATTPNLRVPAIETPQAQLVVATLTAQRDAVWVAGTLAPGSELHPGDRFTLIQGFAEITTNRGAVATLEAPATIELLDSDNAIQLHAGKLIGVCNTPSSHGFLVRTHDAEVVDVGTIFAVATAPNQKTMTYVIEGEIGVRSVLQGVKSSEATRLTARQSGVIDRTGQVVIGEVADDPGFERLTSHISGVHALSGHVRLLHASHFELGLRSDDALLISDLPEHRLTTDLEVTLNEPGAYSRFSNHESTGTIPAGTTIRSYAMYFRPVGQRERTEDGSAFVQGRVTFEGKVLGLITNQSRADQFARAIGPSVDRLIDTKQRLAWPDDNSDIDGDRIELMADGKTVAFQLKAHHVDALRVIVEMPRKERPDPE